MDEDFTGDVSTERHHDLLGAGAAELGNILKPDGGAAMMHAVFNELQPPKYPDMSDPTASSVVESGNLRIRTLSSGSELDTSQQSGDDGVQACVQAGDCGFPLMLSPVPQPSSPSHLESLPYRPRRPSLGESFDEDDCENNDGSNDGIRGKGCQAMNSNGSISAMVNATDENEFVVTVVPDDEYVQDHDSRCDDNYYDDNGAEEAAGLTSKTFVDNNRDSRSLFPGKCGRRRNDTGDGANDDANEDDGRDDRQLKKGGSEVNETGFLVVSKGGGEEGVQGGVRVEKGSGAKVKSPRGKGGKGTLRLLMFQAAPLRSRSTTDDDDDEDEEDVSSLLPPGVASPFSSCSPNSPKYPGGGGSSGGGGGGRGGRGRRKGGGGGGRSPKSPRGEGGGLSSPGGGSRGGGGAGLSAVRRPVPPPSFLSSRANSKHRFWELVWPALAKQGWSLEPGKRKRDNDYYFLPPDIDRNTARYRIDYFDSVKSVVAQVAHVPLFEQAVKEFHAAEAHAHQQRLALEQEAAHTAELQREARRRNAAACHAAAAVCHASLSTSSSSSPTSLSSSARSKGVGAGGVWDACSDSYDGEAGRGDATTKRTRVGAVGASPCAVVGRGAQERRIMLQEQQERSAFLSGGGREEEEEEESSFGGDNDGSGCVGDGGAKKKGGGGRGLGSSLSSKSGGAAMVVSGRRTARKVVKFDPSPAGGVSPKQKGLHRNSWSGASGLMASPESSGGSSSNNRKSTGTANTATAKSGSGGGASGGQTPYSWTESACFGNVNQHQLQGYQHQPVPETEACGLVESGTYSLQLESAEEAEAATLAEMHDSSSTVYPLHPAPPPTWTAAAYLGIFGRGNEKEALAADAAACAPPLVPPRPPPPHGGGGAKDKNGVFLELQQQQQQQRVGMESAGTEPLMLAFHKLKRPSSSPRGCGEDDQRTAAAPFARTFGDHEGRAAYVHDKDSRSLALCPGACPGVCPGTTVSVAPTKHMAGNDAPTDPSIAYKVEQHQQIQHFLLQRHQHLSRHGVAQHQPLSQPLGHALGKEQQQPFVVRSQVRLQVPSLVGDGTPPSLSPPPPRFPPKRHAEVSVCLVDEHSRHVHSQEHLQRQQQHFQLQQSDWRQQQQQQQQRQHQQYPEDASTSSLLFKSAQLTPQFEEQLPPALTTPLSSEMGVGGGSEKSESSSSVVVVEDDDAVMAGEAEAGELLGDLFC